MKQTSILLAITAAVLTLSSCETSTSNYHPNNNYQSGSNYHSNNSYHSGSSYGSYNTPRVTALSNDRYSVSMGGGKVATLNKYGGIVSQANMTSAEQREAGAAVRTYRREQQ